MSVVARVLQRPGDHPDGLLPPGLPGPALGQGGRPQPDGGSKAQGDRGEARQERGPDPHQVADAARGHRHPQVCHAKQDRGKWQHLRLQENIQIFQLFKFPKCLCQTKYSNYFKLSIILYTFIWAFLGELFIFWHYSEVTFKTYIQWFEYWMLLDWPPRIWS